LSPSTATAGMVLHVSGALTTDQLDTIAAALAQETAAP
jgi:hypothetical protein